MPHPFPHPNLPSLKTSANTKAAGQARSSTLALSLSAAFVLSACATPTTPVSKVAYDFGPAHTAAGVQHAPSARPLVLGDLVSNTALSNSAVQYRLNYANAQELRPYSLARWSLSPTALVQQRVRSALSSVGPVLTVNDGTTALSVKVELEEFSQQFDAPESSQGVVIFRATLFKEGALHAQKVFEARATAPTANAAGGVKALAVATDMAASQLALWVKSNAQ